MKKVSFFTLGCKVNAYDSTYMQELFLNNGYTIADFGEPVDIVVVNTCTLTGTADKKSRSIVRRAAKTGKVIVAGEVHGFCIRGYQISHAKRRPKRSRLCL